MKPALLVFALALIALTAVPGMAQTAKSPAKKPAALGTGYFIPAGDSLLIPSFGIEVRLSPRAQAKLAADKETIIVHAFFSGIPKNKHSAEYRESGMMTVRQAETELRPDQPVATFSGVKISRAAYNALASKDIELLINVYSGRKSSGDNLLDCEIVQDKMSVLKGRKIVLKAKLIGEG